MTHELLTALAAFVLVTLVTPGPNNLMLMASGMNYGIVRTIPHMLGIGIGFPVMVLLVGAGLMGVFEAVPYSYAILQVISAMYLLYLSWKIAVAAPVQQGEAGSSSRPFTFLQAAIFQWVNPKAWAMALTAVSVYTPPSKPIWSVLVIALMFTVMGLPSISLWAFLGQQLRRILNNPLRLRIFNICCGLLLAASLYPLFAGSA